MDKSFSELVFTFLVYQKSTKQQCNSFISVILFFILFIFCNSIVMAYKF